MVLDLSLVTLVLFFAIVTSYLSPAAALITVVLRDITAMQ